MKIHIEDKCSDGYGSLYISIDGTKVLNFCDGEPEDNNLGRNFNDCYIIPDILKKVHEAGLRGEPLEFSESRIEE